MPPRARTRWTTGFGTWIASMGVYRVRMALADTGCSVTEQAIYHWLAGTATPRTEHAMALQRVSGGAVTLEVILQHRSEVRDGGAA